MKLRVILLSVIVLVILTSNIYLFAVRPVITNIQLRQAQLNVQRRCEEEFARYPRQRGKTLQDGIEKCRKVAGLKAVGGTKR